MIFVVFLCLDSLFRYREVFYFFNFLCHLLFFSVQVLCLEQEKSFFFSISYVIYCFSMFTFSVQKKGSAFCFVFNFLCYFLFFSVQILCLEIEKSFFFSISYVIHCFSVFRFSVQKKRSLFFFQFLMLFIFFSLFRFSVQKKKSLFFQFLMLFIVFLCLGSLFRKREVFFFSISYVIYCFSLFRFSLEKEKKF